MENIRTNKAARAAAMILVLVLITMCILSGTLAKYITNDSGNDSARVAKFGVVASISGNLFGYAYKYDGDTKTPEADTSAIAKYDEDKGLNDGYVVQTSQVSDKIVAPGTYNDKGMTFKILGKPEVATKVEFADSDITNEDIYLAEGSYGVMVALTPDEIAQARANFVSTDEYYTVSSGTYTKIATQEGFNGDVYKLQDTATVGTGGYYPLKWKVNDTDCANVAAVRAAIAGIAGQNDPNYQYNKTYTVTWAWPFEATGDEERDATDAKDTILGDMIAKVVSPSENGHYEVVKFNGDDYKTVTCTSNETEKEAKVGDEKVANLQVAFGGAITVKQIVKEEELLIHNYGELKAFAEGKGDFAGIKKGKLGASFEVPKTVDFTDEKELDLNGYTITGTITQKEVAHDCRSVIYVSEGGDLTINDTKGTGMIGPEDTAGVTTTYAVYNKGNLTINGGKYQGGKSLYDEGCWYYSDAVAVSDGNTENTIINGGTFSNQNPSEENTSNKSVVRCTINDGLFSHKPTDSVVKYGYDISRSKNEDGYYYVVEK